jgi:predicted PurR-regulated permease PerM
MSKPNLGELIFFWILFGAVGFLSFEIMSPYFSALFLGGIFAVLFSPLYRRLLRMVKGHETYAALLSVILVLCLVLLPLVFLGVLLFQEVFSIYGALTSENNFVLLANKLTDFVTVYIQQFVPSFTINADLSVYAKEALGWIAVHLNSFFSGILSLIFQIFLVIIAMFFLLRDGTKLRMFAIKLSPLDDAYDESILSKLEHAISSIVTGTLFTAIIQGTLVGIGFAIFGVPNSVLWGSTAVVAALIPMVGTSIVTIPAGIIFLFGGNLVAGIGLIVWALFVGSIDNLIRPFLIKRGVNVHPFFILLSVLGGLAYFGPIGFLAGPIVLAFFFTLLEIYPTVVRGRAVKESESSIV